MSISFTQATTIFLQLVRYYKTKKFILVFVTSFAISICNSQNFPWGIYKNELNKIDLNGHILKLEQFHLYASTFGGVEKIYRRSEMGGYNHIKNFDTSGNIISQISINSDSTIDDTTYYIYDKSLLRTQISTSDSFKFYTTYLYDESRTLIRKIEHEKNDTYSIVSYFYDKIGRITKMISDDKKGSTLDYVYNYEYNPKKNTIKTIIYDENNNIFETRNCKYNKTGMLIEMTIKFSNSFIRVHYEYNDKGLLIKENSTDNLGMKSKSTINYNYEYDIMGNWVKKSVYRLYSYDGEVFIRKLTYQ